MELKSIFDFFANINSTLVALCAIGGHLFVLYKKLKPYTTITDDIMQIRKELTSNGGQSLKDFVKQIKTDVQANTDLTKTIMCRQRWILDNRTEPIFETDEKGNFTWVNEAFIRLTKRSCFDLLGNKWKNIIEESQRDAVFEHWDRAIEEKRNFEETIQIMDKKGNKYSAMCVATIQQDGKYIGSFTEIEQIEK